MPVINNLYPYKLKKYIFEFIKQIKLFKTIGDAQNVLKNAFELMCETYPQWDERTFTQYGIIEEFTIEDGFDPNNNYINAKIKKTMMPMSLARLLQY